VSKACFQKTQSPATTILTFAPKFLSDITVHFSKLSNEDLTVQVSSFSETLEQMAVSVSAKMHINSQLTDLSDNKHEMLIVLKAGAMIEILCCSSMSIRLQKFQIKVDHI
jgi:hypothetical protein